MAKFYLKKTRRTELNGFFLYEKCILVNRRMNLERSNSEQKENAAKSKVDMITFERRQRQFLNELAMKRTQVEELKKELDAANLKIHELTRALDSAKSTNEDHQYNLNLAIKNARFFEDQLQVKRDFVTRSRLQQESAAAEKESLKEHLQKAELQNYNLLQEINELKAQHSCDIAYQKELMNEDGKIRAKIAQVTKAFQEFQIDQNEITQLSDKVYVKEELQKSVAFYQKELYKYREKCEKMEGKFIVANAAMAKFQKLAADHNELFHLNQENEIIVTQWKNATRWFNEQTNLQTEIIENLTESLKTEKEANINLCVHESELETKQNQLQEEIQELKTKLNHSVKKHSDVAVQTYEDISQEVVKLVKTEVVEILEDN